MLLKEWLTFSSRPEPDVDAIAPLDPRAVRAIATWAELRAPLQRGGHIITRVVPQTLQTG